MAKKKMAAQRKKEREGDVRWAIGVLLFVGIFQVVVGLYYHQRVKTVEAFPIDAGIGALFIALSFHAKKEPIQALTVSLIAYVSIIVLAIIIFQTNPFSGIILKIIVISALVSGIRAAKKLGPTKPKDDDILDGDDDFEEL